MSAATESRADLAQICHCPACGGSYVHLGAVTVEQGPEVAIVRASGVTTGLREEPWGRGSTVRILAWCEECPATHAIVVAFHKGQTKRRLEVVGSRGDDEPKEELWRS